MAKLAITNDFLHNLLREVAPLVSQATGWDLNLPDLRLRVVPKDQGYEEILLGRLHHIGIIGWEEATPDFLERMIEYMIEENALAAYMPGTGEILVIRENVDDSNLDGLKLILAHELVHRGQHMVHGDLMAQADNLLLQAFTEMKAYMPDMQKIRQCAEQIQPIMTLLESHATYIHSQLKQTHFTDARVETHFNLATLLMRLLGAPKVAQYTGGLPQVSAAAASGSLDSLYTGFKN